MSDAKGKQIVMFLDYDGTLSLITEDHDKAYITDEVPLDLAPCYVVNSLSLVLELMYIYLQMREVVKEVAIYFKTAIISGRSTDKVYSIN